MTASRPPSLVRDEERFNFPGLGGQPSVCRLRLFNAATINKVTAVVTEIDDNTGTSVTNSAGSLANEICERFAIEPSRFILIEHYAEERGERATFDESYSQVNLSYHPSTGFKRTDWTHLKLDDVARMTDTPVEEWMPPPVEDGELEEVEA